MMAISLEKTRRKKNAPVLEQCNGAMFLRGVCDQRRSFAVIKLHLLGGAPCCNCSATFSSRPILVPVYGSTSQTIGILSPISPTNGERLIQSLEDAKFFYGCRSSSNEPIHSEWRSLQCVIRGRGTNHHASNYILPLQNTWTFWRTFTGTYVPLFPRN